MYPILFEHDALSWNSFGIGVLSDAITCEAEENRNGSYEVELTYPITGAFFAEIKLRRLILAKPNFSDDPQPFRIYFISKPLNGVITVNAQHISYDLSGYVDSPFTAADSQLAVSKLTDSSVIFPLSCPFSFSTDITSSSSFALKHPESVRSIMGGIRGSLIDVYGGEWHFDKFNCRLYSNRGETRGVTIMYGKNLTDLKQEENNANVYTAVYPYYYNSDSETLVVLPEKVINTPGTYPYTKVLNLDLSNDFEETPSVADLRSKAEQYISNNDIGKPVVNLTVSFVDDGEVNDRVDLCDTVSVYFDQLGVMATAKCIRTRWDVLKDRYIEAELGSARNSLAEDIANSSEISNAIDERTSQFKRIAAGIVGKVTGNSGGYIVLHDTNNDGEPDEILIMDSDDINTAIKIIRFNNAGIAFSKTGYNGTYNTAWTIDGEFVADFIASGELHTDMVKVLGDTNFYWDNNNITIVSPSDQNKMIRFGKYDGVNYGLGFSIDGGTTWSSGLDFNGIRLLNPISGGWAKMDGETFEIRDANDVTTAYIGNYENCVDRDGNYITAPRYMLGTREIGTDVGAYSFAGGRETEVSGAYTIAIGYKAASKEFYALAMGYYANASKQYSIAIGYEATTGASHSISMGSFSETSGSFSCAIGYEADAGVESFSLGAMASSKNGSCAIGYQAEALSQYCVAIGREVTVDKYAAPGARYSVGIGYKVNVSEEGCVAIGYNSETSNKYAVAIGSNCKSSAIGSVAVGYMAKANGEGQLACGSYNSTGTNYKFIVGNGTSDSSRSYAFRVHTNGNATLAGTLTQNSDARQKDIIGEAPDLSGVRAVKFVWNDKKLNHDDREHIGYIAQDVEKVAPYLVETDEDTGYKSIEYIELLCAKIEQLERTVERLTKRVEELERVTV